MHQKHSKLIMFDSVSTIMGFTTHLLFSVLISFSAIFALLLIFFGIIGLRQWWIQKKIKINHIKIKYWPFRYMCNVLSFLWVNILYLYIAGYIVWFWPILKVVVELALFIFIRFSLWLTIWLRLKNIPCKFSKQEVCFFYEKLIAVWNSISYRKRDRFIPFLITLGVWFLCVTHYVVFAELITMIVLYGAGALKAMAIYAALAFVLNKLLS